MDNHLEDMIRHYAHQTGSTPVHLDNESVKGLRNLHHLVHNEDVGHDFSKLKTLFTQPNIAQHLKAQIEQKKANGGVINDYINTLKHNGSGESSELSLVPDELVKFLDDSYSLGTTNPHTGHKEYYLGNMFNSLNNIFKPIKDSMKTTHQTSPIPIQTLTQMHEEQPSREGHAFGNIVGYGSGGDTPSWATPSYGAGYGSGSNTPSWATSPTTSSVTANPVPTLPTGIGNSAVTGSTSSQPGLIQRGMQGIAGRIGSGIGGLGAQFAGQRVGQGLAQGIPFLGPLVAPIAGQVAGNIAYNAGASRGRSRGVELADRFYNYLGGGRNTTQINPSPPTTLGSSMFSRIGNTAYNAGSSFGNAISGFGRKVYNSLPSLPRFSKKPNLSSSAPSSSVGASTFLSPSTPASSVASSVPSSIGTSRSVGTNPFLSPSIPSSVASSTPSNPFLSPSDDDDLYDPNDVFHDIE